jgi:hypothetical protein
MLLELGAEPQVGFPTFSKVATVVISELQHDLLFPIA